MPNTTDFFTCPKRTIYLASDSDDVNAIADSLLPSLDNTPINTTADIVIDFGKEIEFSHVYIQHEGVAALQMFVDRDLMTRALTETLTFDTEDAPSKIHALKKKDDDPFSTVITQYLRFKATGVSVHTPNIIALVPMNLILCFQDGAFNQINFRQQHRTRGHHKMMNGGFKPFQGLGIEKREMAFGSEYVPYSYIPKLYPPATNADDPPLQQNASLKLFLEKELESRKSDLESIEWYFPLGKQVRDKLNEESEDDYKKYLLRFLASISYGHDDIFEQADIKRINSLFRGHLEFIFADNLDVYPDRIFKASFKENSLDEPFSNQLKEVGYSVSFTVCEV